MTALLIRADAGPTIGIGHLMRCLALAQAWDGPVRFLTACDQPTLLDRIAEEGFALELLPASHPDPADWPATAAALSATPGVCVVLDGYHLDTDYQRRVRQTGHPLLVIDDMVHLAGYEADLLLNQNLHARPEMYADLTDAQLLLGSRHVLLRQAFFSARTQRQIPPRARNLLVTLGGSDPSNQTAKVIAAVGMIDDPGLAVTLVIGASNPHDYNPDDPRISLLRATDQMPALMAAADLVVSAAGSTCWEIAYMGLPAILLTVVDNQQGIASHLEQAGCAIDLGLQTDVCAAQIAQALESLLASAEARRKMSAAGATLIDGQGASRVAAALRALA